MNPDLKRIFTDAAIVLPIGIPFCIALYFASIVVGTAIVAFLEIGWKGIFQ